MSTIEEFISEEKIKEKVQELAQQITNDYKGKELVVVCVLNGSFMFCADLIRELNLPVTMEFISVSSYGNEMKSSGKVKIQLDLKNDIKNKDVLLVEDIVDTGLTMTQLIEHLKTKSPRSLKLASLLFKPAKLEHKITIDYLAFEISDKFVVGYGLDLAGRYRELPYIGIYKDV